MLGDRGFSAVSPESSMPYGNTLRDTRIPNMIFGILLGSRIFWFSGALLVCRIQLRRIPHPASLV